ncbi:hypothetical protein PRIPAC_78968 [Pristionchus pacificus]|uniref:Transmembrane ion channel n=1 Tax=Pristionchus pacificus TaxID=54126 RepID=A0A2A6CKR4_PRIPA|nr:hypothetical protein PRIPAC_78968 [Pristionchus pacificus]|eukprot:PDM78709.1 transmembrane ion channel [Pristionchus pacificus]
MRLSLLILYLAVTVSGADDFKSYWVTMKKLQLQLFTDYDNLLSPYSTKDANYTWNVVGGQASVQLVRSKLLSVHEPEQQFTAATCVLMYQYNGISHLYMKRSRVWMPEIIPCDSTGVETVTFDNNNVKIYFDGRVEMHTCFFATHNCEIKQKYWYQVDELQLSVGQGGAPDLFGTGEFDYAMFKPRPSFTMASTDENVPFSSAMFHFVISREPQFWVCLIIIPTFLIGMLVLIGIFFGEEGNSLNEAVELGLTGMMSLTVIVGILNDSIAKSKSLSALGRFVFFDIIIVVVAIVVILFVDKIRRNLKRLSEEKLKFQKTSAAWLWVKSYVTSNKICRYLLFAIFSVLHVVNLIMMLIRPADTGAFETLTTFNVTIS